MMADLLYVLLAGAVFGLDRAGKRASRNKYSDGKVRVIGCRPIGKKQREAAAGDNAGTGGKQTHGVIAVRNLHNHGAMLNLGEKHSMVIKVISVGLTVFLTIVFILTLGHAGKNLLKTGLSLLLGGAFSNTYDRLKDGYVTDYVSFRFGPKALQKVVFNIGDFAIIIGALLVAIGA